MRDLGRIQAPRRRLRCALQPLLDRRRHRRRRAGGRRRPRVLATAVRGRVGRYAAHIWRRLCRRIAHVSHGLGRRRRVRRVRVRRSLGICRRARVCARRRPVSIRHTTRHRRRRTLRIGTRRHSTRRRRRRTLRIGARHVRICAGLPGVGDGRQVRWTTKLRRQARRLAECVCALVRGITQGDTSVGRLALRIGRRGRAARLCIARPANTLAHVA